MTRLRTRAFSLVELIVVLFLSAIFGIMVVQAIDSVSTSARDGISDVTSRTAARDLVDEVTASVRSARPLAKCSVGVDLSSCLRTNAAPALAYAEKNCLVFYGYSTGNVSELRGAVGTNVLGAPDLITVRLVGADGAPRPLLVERFAPTKQVIQSADLLTGPAAGAAVCARPDSSALTATQAPGWSGPTPFRVTRVNNVQVGASGMFTLLKANSSTVPNWSTATDADRAAVSLVSVRAQFLDRNARDASRSFDVNLVVDLPASDYRSSAACRTTGCASSGGN